MIDLHTHMLWDWDDGPDDRLQSIEMCRAAVKDGIRAVAVTPHLFRRTRHGDDLSLLRTRMLEFKEATAGLGLEIHWGAEVYIHPDIVRMVERYRFSLDQTSYVIVEFPSDLVPAGADSMISGLMSRGFIPVISHPERNADFRSRPELLYSFVAMGCAAQVTAGSLTGEFGREVRNAAGLFLVNNLVQSIVSDAHGTITRRPVLSEAMAAASKIIGPEKAMAMVTAVPRAMLENRAVPDLGEPRNPLRGGSWTRRLFGRPAGGGSGRESN